MRLSGSQVAVGILAAVAITISLVALLTVKVVPARQPLGFAQCNRAHPCASPTPRPSPTATPVPTPSGHPWDPYGALFKKDFGDGTLAPFFVQTWPDDHIGQPGQWMTSYTRFSNGAAHATVHDGYLDLTATKRGDGLWDGVLAGSSVQWQPGPTVGYGITRMWLSWNIGPGTWQAGWQYDTTAWTALEIDFPEMLEDLNLTAHVLGSGNDNGFYGLPKPADLATAYHEFKVERRASFVAFSIDGTEVARWIGTVSNRQLAILLDVAMGFGWMGGSGQITSQTPNPTYLHVAAVTVDP